MANNPYSLVHTKGFTQPASALNFKTYDERGHITPNFEFSEGQRPAGEFNPAPYLSAVRFNKYFEEFFVLSGGKVVALDSNGWVVPAGLRKQAADYKTTFDGVDEATADALPGLTLYTQVDVDRGVVNANGDPVAVDEPVVKSMFDIAGGTPLAQNVVVSNPVGVSMYNYWAHPGGNGENPVDFNQYNFNLQNKVVFLCDYQIELPIVTDNATYDASPFAGMGAMIAAGTVTPGDNLATSDVAPGMFVTFDYNSNFVVSADDGGYGYGSTTGTAEVLGQVLSLDLRQVRDLLDKVRSRYNDFGELEKMPGTATEGKSDTLTYSGGYGLVRINLQLR